MIHPTAVVSPKAELDPSVEVGPLSVIDAGVQLDADCWVGPFVHLTGCTRIGKRNRFYSGAVIGEAPQDVKYSGSPTELLIGEGNLFREHVTVHRSNKLEEATVIGDANFFMAHSHVGHNAQIGNHVIVANGALIAGHVTVEDRVFISGNCLIHQFVRIGTMALMQGGAGISLDLPPFTVGRGNNNICGLNTVGLRRGGVDAASRLQLKRLYKHLFRGEMPLRASLVAARVEFSDPWTMKMMDFIEASTRGVCAERLASRHDGAE